MTNTLGQTISTKAFYEATENALTEFAKMEMQVAALRQAMNVIVRNGVIDEENLGELTQLEIQTIKRAQAYL